MNQLHPDNYNFIHSYQQTKKNFIKFISAKDFFLSANILWKNIWECATYFLLGFLLLQLP
jgi:hypothetical protein